MTRERAIKHLEIIKSDCALVGDIHALDMAISALSADGEYIKKEDALKRPYALWNGSEYVYVVNADYLNGLQTYSFPDSAENKGEWIEVVTERFPNGKKQMWHYECSACGMGEPPYPINKEHWDFCPNCGADMRGDKAE